VKLRESKGGFFTCGSGGMGGDDLGSWVVVFYENLSGSMLALCQGVFYEDLSGAMLGQGGKRMRRVSSEPRHDVRHGACSVRAAGVARALQRAAAQVARHPPRGAARSGPAPVQRATHTQLPLLALLQAHRQRQVQRGLGPHISTNLQLSCWSLKRETT